VPRKRGTRAADISTHRGFWNLPRDFGAKMSRMVLMNDSAIHDPVFDAVVRLNRRVKAKRGMFGTYGTKTLALPKAMAHHGCLVVDGIQDVEAGGRTLRTSSGETLADIDAIIFCTGYTNRVEFTPEGLRGVRPRGLYKHIFHTDTRDRLAWVGWARPAFGSQFPIMEMQARLIAQVFAGDHVLPDAATMTAAAEADRKAFQEQFETSGQRIESLVDYFTYMDDLATLIGCYPPLTSYFFLRPGLWLHLVYGPAQATQFRLRGPGSKPALAESLLRKIPVSKFNHVVKAGLRGRCSYLIRKMAGLTGNNASGAPGNR